MSLLFLENERYGGGNAGVVSENTGTDAPIDAPATGTAGQKTIAATNVAFSPGQLILVIDMNSNARELNIIKTYSAGSIGTKYELANTYTKAQVIVVSQTSSYTIPAGQTVTVKAWDGSVGGVFIRMADGPMSIGSINGKGKGFRGGTGASGTIGQQGEGTGGTPGNATARNGNGGGGGSGVTIGSQGDGAGGGGNAANGDDGVHKFATVGQGGALVGDVGLNTISMGGGGGGGARGGTVTGTGGNGGRGAAIVILIYRSLVITGGIDLRGDDGGNASPDEGSGGGGGAGGSFLGVGLSAAVGSNLIDTRGGAKGFPVNANSGDGGKGADGRVHIDYLTSKSGTALPSLDASLAQALADIMFGGVI